MKTMQCDNYSSEEINARLRKNIDERNASEKSYEAAEKISEAKEQFERLIELQKELLRGIEAAAKGRKDVVVRIDEQYLQAAKRAGAEIGEDFERRVHHILYERVEEAVSRIRARTSDKRYRQISHTTYNCMCYFVALALVNFFVAAWGFGAGGRADTAALLLGGEAAVSIIVCLIIGWIVDRGS